MLPRWFPDTRVVRNGMNLMAIIFIDVQKIEKRTSTYGALNRRRLESFRCPRIEEAVNESDDRDVQEVPGFRQPCSPPQDSQNDRTLRTWNC